MKENEIKKALEEKIKALKDDYKRLQLLDAPMDCFEESHIDNIRVLSNALDLINRLQTKLCEVLKVKARLKINFIDARKEISRLKAENERLQKVQGDYAKAVLDEYAERLKNDFTLAMSDGNIPFCEIIDELTDTMKSEYSSYMVREDKAPSVENNFLLNRFMKKE